MQSLWISIPLMLFLVSSTVKCEMRAYKCYNTTTYSVTSNYSRELNKVLGDLTDHIDMTMFKNISYGEISGLAQCRADMILRDCSNCLMDAKGVLQLTCGNASGGLIWLDKCFLRYTNLSMSFSHVDAHVIDILENPEDVKDDDAAGFRNRVADLVRNLTASVVDGNGFVADYSSSPSVYVVGQCLRDLSVVECKSCLLVAFSLVYSHFGKRGVEILTGSCSIRFETYPFFNLSSAHPFYVSTSSANTSSAKMRSRRLAVILGGVGGGIIALAVSLCGFVFLMRRHKEASGTGSPRRLLTSSHKKVEAGERRGSRSIDMSSSLMNPQMIFNLETLIEATGDFHDDNKLGEGGFGPVYKGTTSDGMEIAIKKLSLSSVQGTTEFMNEVKLVANIQHRNLVKLLGCCVEGPERLLVYEYLPNKSLDKFLFDPQRKGVLDWQKRSNIVIGIARGLLYLHEDSQLRIVHRDIKASNILLDEKLNPKIADFGLAKLFPDDETHVETRIAGTCGYMAPEYASGGQLSAKADVYSFGVLLLEIVSGRKNTEKKLPQEVRSLLEWAWRLHKRGHMIHMIDPIVMESCVVEQALRLIHIGLLCVQGDAALRPPISEVILMISSNSMAMPNPTKPAFVSFSGESPVYQGFHANIAAVTNLGAASSSSSASTSITNVEPR